MLSRRINGGLTSFNPVKAVLMRRVCSRRGTKINCHVCVCEGGGLKNGEDPNGKLKISPWVVCGVGGIGAAKHTQISADFQ